MRVVTKRPNDGLSVWPDDFSATADDNVVNLLR